MSQNQQNKSYLLRQSTRMFVATGFLLMLASINLYAAKPPPTALSCSISPDGGTTTTGTSVTFTGSADGGAKGGKNYSWDFSAGSGSADSLTNSTANVIYNTAGAFAVLLEVSDRAGTVANCSTTIDVTDGGGGDNNPPAAVGDDYGTTKGQQLTITAPGVLTNDFDQDGDTLTAVLESGTTENGSNVSLSSDGSFVYTPNANFTGSDSFTYTAFDGTDSSLIAIVNINVTDNNVADFSINSTSRSQGAPATTLVTEQAFITNPLYQILAINDLGMHCGDLDTRISSILPPFNVLHSQVVERGTATSKPRVMNEGEVHLFYSAVSNGTDPVLSTAPVLAKDGSLYKANFWDIARQAYAPFYPSGILELFYPAGSDIVGIGLPVPDVERFYLEDGFLAAGQQAMPGIFDPLVDNVEQPFHEHIGTLPFFTGFAFGYTADVNWFEAAGIPMAVYDDTGRKNPYPLMRVQAKVGEDIVATVDAVVPISGEAECQRCHAAAIDGGNGAATQELLDNGITVYDSIDDPAEDVPFEASIEWASDLNIIALHDLKHNTTLSQGFDANGKANNPVVCQTCHYTPALDLAQFGPLGPENDNVDPIILNDGAIVIDSLANGRDQAKNKSMSNVMHNNHANVTDLDGNPLFPAMPPAVDAQGNKRDPLVTQDILSQTCYSCHPGNKTKCMRGAMANGGQVCQDCHGDMNQVGDDFSRNVGPDNIGAFEVKPDFYTNPATPRVPWANEPGCGSCHTGSATDNLAADNNTLVNPFDSVGNVDGIRLAQAFLTDDSKATPIVPVNKMFAENVVAEGTAADGNPKLYRVSTGHAGLFCEACHGATHAEWPNAIPGANDNVASLQMQGHTGTVTECLTCHEPTDASLPLGNNGPHGMHPISDYNTADTRWNKQHRNYRNQGPGCHSCHGDDLKGTVLSRAATDRLVRCKDTKGSLSCTDDGSGELFATIPKGTPVGCGMCHQQKR